MQAQDLLILLFLQLEKTKTYQKDIADRLMISRAGVSYSINRLIKLNLLSNDRERIMTQTILDFIKYAIHIVYPAHQGPRVKGVLTANLFELDGQIISNDKYVWKSSSGKDIGQEISPLYHTAPLIVESEPALYQALQMIDIIRLGNSREKNLAYNKLVSLLKGV